MEVLHECNNRPKVFDDGDLAFATEAMANGVLSGSKSRRQTQNRLYALRGLEWLGLLGNRELKRALAERPALSWLVDENGARWSILAELGRIRDSPTSAEPPGYRQLATSGAQKLASTRRFRRPR
jgi:hypothetical protein